MEDSVRKIKTVKSVTFAKKIEIGEPVTLAKNIVSVPIKFIFASVSIPVKSICDSFLVKSVEFVEFVKNFSLLIWFLFYLFASFECFYFWNW